MEPIVERCCGLDVHQATVVACLLVGRADERPRKVVRTLDGRMEEHHRFLLKLQLRRLEQVDADIAELEARIEQQLAPYQEQRRRLMKIPGVDRIVAATLIAEVGGDMSAFQSASHLAAWTGVSPGNNESAGK